MKREEFALALNALLPGCHPEAASKWAEFAAECVNHEQFMYFIPTEYNAAVEKWLDAIYAGLYAVKQEYGLKIAARVAVLGCHRCDLYPGEMISAAEILKNGGDADRINAMRALGRLEMNKPYFLDLPDGAALTRQGPEIDIIRFGVPCGLVREWIAPGYVLADGTALLESERDGFGRYRGGAGNLQTGRLYAPVCGVDGQLIAFQEVKPVTAREREAVFLAAQGDAFAIYRLKTAHAEPEGYVPLDNLQKSGGSPLDGNYNLIHVVPIRPGAGIYATLEACRSVDTVRPGDIVAFKQAGGILSWYVDQLAFSPLPGLLENYLKSSEMNAEQNYNQLDGIINNEAPKPSLRDNLKQCQREVEASQPVDIPSKPHQGQER